MQDKWILNHPTNMVIHPPTQEEWEWRVSNLIDWRIYWWDRDLIEFNFHWTDEEAILRISLSKRYVCDSVLWMYNKNGAYSVKSGYHIARLISKEDNGMVESLEPMVGGQVWGKLWKLHVPRKIKIFGWRACQDILLTRQNLVKRRVIENGISQYM